MDHGQGAIIGAFGGLLAELAKLNWTMYIILLFVSSMDVLTGMLKARREGRFDSTVLGDKLSQKVIQAIIVFVLMIVNIAAREMGVNFPLDNIIIGAYIFKETLSLLENGGKVPNIIKYGIRKANNIINDTGEEKKEDVE